MDLTNPTKSDNPDILGTMVEKGAGAKGQKQKRERERQSAEGAETSTNPANLTLVGTIVMKENFVVCKYNDTKLSSELEYAIK